jgi:bifunctional DNA-binding transcriptional regulator/antitoxin component of YhaV-PrlF toxin-antitoxin module
MAKAASDAETKLWTLNVHDDKFSTEELVINAETFGVKVGDVVEIFHPNKRQKAVLLKVPSNAPIKGKPSWKKKKEQKRKAEEHQSTPVNESTELFLAFFFIFFYEQENCKLVFYGTLQISSN